mgnify:CR=1 FL=1|jgi:hypothetical protein
MAVITVETIKIGRVTYEVKSGDFIMYNGVNHMFVAGDKRILKTVGWVSYDSLVMPKSLVKKIPFIRMTKVNGHTGKWYF